MLGEEYVFGELHARRYRGEDAKYALVISNGTASYGGVYDAFGIYHEARGADIWSYSAPGHGEPTPSSPLSRALGDGPMSRDHGPAPAPLPAGNVPRLAAASSRARTGPRR